MDAKQRVTRAPARTKILNPITTTLMRLGVRADPRMALLTIRGRKTGRHRTVPMGVFDRDGRKYIVAAFGEVNWVLNLRAAGAVIITQGQRKAKYAAEQVQGGKLLWYCVIVSPRTCPARWPDRCYASALPSMRMRHLRCWRWRRDALPCFVSPT